MDSNIEFFRAISDLRRDIRRSGKKYKQHKEQSQSLFNAPDGFTYAYQIIAVEAALERFEEKIRKLSLVPTLPIKPDKLTHQAQLVMQHHPSEDARQLAADTLQYLATKQ